MKHLLLFLLAVSIVAIAGDSVPPSPAGGSTGRYQLAGGTSPGVKVSESYQTMFRIDTETGKVWQIQGVPMDVRGHLIPIPTWIEVHETNGDIYRAALQGASR